jgi:hypothetical protein
MIVLAAGAEVPGLGTTALGVIAAVMLTRRDPARRDPARHARSDGAPPGDLAGPLIATEQGAQADLQPHPTRRDWPSVVGPPARFGRLWPIRSCAIGEFGRVAIRGHGVVAIRGLLGARVLVQ